MERLLPRVPAIFHVAVIARAVHYRNALVKMSDEEDKCRAEYRRKVKALKERTGAPEGA